MHPVLITIGPLTIHTYGFLLAIGVLLAILLSLKLGKKENLDTRTMSDFIFYAIIIGLLGAKLWLFVTEIDYYLKYTHEIPSLLTSAGSFYGGLIFGAIFVVWYVRKKKLDIRKIGDVVMPSVALAHFFGRMGCFMAGCCWGRPSGSCPIGVTFTSMPNTTGVPHDIALYPTQLTESLLNLLNFIILIILFNKKKFKGQVLAVYIFNYSIIRLVVEYFRGDNDRGYVFGGLEQPFTSLSVPQLVSLVGVVLSIILYLTFKKRHERTRSNQEA